MRGDSTDYWINGMAGEPFFVVRRTVQEGLLNALEEEIIPQLLQMAPPTDNGVRFTLIFV